MSAMQVITPASTRRARDRRSRLVGAVIGIVLLAGGLAIGWLTFGTPFLSRFSPIGRPDTSQQVAGVLAWTVALIAPATFIVFGLAKIATIIDAGRTARQARTPVARLARTLGDEYVVASRLRLPDGRLVPELVVGPFGAAVIRELPPSAATRRRGSAWEVRTTDGTWAPLENPLDRAARDAESVRRWLGQHDQDFLVKVYAAVVAHDETIPRTPMCAVVTQGQIGSWLASLPPQRSLTAARMDQLLERLRTAG
jgi:hypothetical protein